MLVRHAAWVLMAALACAPAPKPVMPPAAPVLEGDGEVSALPNWKLVGSAPEGSLVRVYVDVECRGPAWRDFSAEDLGAGVVVDLVSGTENIFAAVTIDASGAASECSAPIRVRYVRPPLPQRPNTRLIPPLPTREAHFELRGTATDAVTVRLYEVNCQGTPIATLREADYEADGFALDVLPNRSYVYALDAINVLGERSGCTPPVSVFSDQLPPAVTAILKSPTPDRESRAYLQITTEAGASGSAQLGPGCVGATLGFCSGTNECALLEVVFPEVAVQSWSAFAIDSLGNRSACVDSAEPWGWDLLADPAVQLFVNDQVVTALVPTSSEWVEIYSGPSCDPLELKNRVSARQAIAGTGTWLFAYPTDGGVLTARGTSADGGVQYPCSTPVPWN